MRLYVLPNLYVRLYVHLYVLANSYLCSYVHLSVLPNSYVRSYVCLYVLPNSYVCLYVLQNLYVRLYVHPNLYLLQKNIRDPGALMVRPFIIIDVLLSKLQYTGLNWDYCSMQYGFALQWYQSYWGWGVYRIDSVGAVL